MVNYSQLIDAPDRAARTVVSRFSTKTILFFAVFWIISITASLIIGGSINAKPIINLRYRETTHTANLSAQVSAAFRTMSTTTVQRKPFESFICTNTTANRFPISTTAFSNDSFDIYRKIALEKYCNIVPMPQQKWVSARRYREYDIAFVIFTASSFFHTRATATRDTWLSRISNYYFLSATPYPYLPVTVIPGAGENKLSNMKKIFYGLQVIYQKQMNISADRRQKWFYIIGCDTFVLPHHLLKRLDTYDYREPLFIGGHSDRHKCLGSDKTDFKVEFPSGGAGFFISIKLLEKIQPRLTNYVEHVWPKDSEISDVALSCLIYDLGINLTKQIGFWAQTPEITLKEHGREVFHQVSEPNNFHYVQPDEMYALDEFYVHQYMDRLVYDENWDEFIVFSRRFIASHYELLRKKRRECTLPAIGPEVKLVSR